MIIGQIAGGYVIPISIPVKHFTPILAFISIIFQSIPAFLGEWIPPPAHYEKKESNMTDKRKLVLFVLSITLPVVEWRRFKQVDIFKIQEGGKNRE